MHICMYSFSCFFLLCLATDTECSSPVLYSVTPFVTLFYIPSFLSQYYACAFGTCLTFFFPPKLKLFKELHDLTLNQSFRAFSLICSWTALILWSKDQLSMFSSLASSRAAISALPSEGASEGGGHDENTER